MTEISAALALAQRDFLKLLRDRARLLTTFIFPFVFIGLLGGGLQASFGNALGFNFLAFTLIGVLAQTVFQSTALGIISLLQDRETDFSQEIFVSPISRYTIVFGKIFGETLVSLPQGAGIVLFGIVLQIGFTLPVLLGLLVTAIIVSLFGGAFGLLVLSFVSNQRAANQIFPFVFLPQFFLAGVFTPIGGLPWYLDIASRLAPMRYAVDLMRGVFYAGQPVTSNVLLESPVTNLVIIGVLFVIFMVFGTFMFVRSERNR